MSRIRLELYTSYSDALAKIDDNLHNELNLRPIPGRRHRWIGYPIASDAFFLLTLGLELDNYVDIYDIDISYEGGGVG